MSKKFVQLWTVVRFEFVRQVKKPSFWASILLIPLLILGVAAISIWGSSGVGTGSEIDESTTFAITDEAGVLPEGYPFRVASKEQGVAAVSAGEVDLYFYIPADFLEGRKVEFYHLSEGLGILDFSGEAIRPLLRQAVADRVEELDFVALSGDYEVVDHKLGADGEGSNALGKAVIPLVILVFFFLFVCLFGNRLIMTVVEEKENRISEMILTSVSSKHLIVGKIVAMMALGLVQMLTIAVPLLVILAIYRENTVVAEVLAMVEFDPISIIENVILFVFSVFLVIGVCTLIGAIAPTVRDASQFIGPVIIGIMFPFYFMQAFFVDPSFMVFFLAYFPLSAPVALMLRNAFGTLSEGELVAGLVELGVLSWVVIALTVRTFQRNAIKFELRRRRRG